MEVAWEGSLPSWSDLLTTLGCRIVSCCRFLVDQLQLRAFCSIHWNTALIKHTTTVEGKAEKGA
jgi:hypothetical protein